MGDFLRNYVRLHGSQAKSSANRATAEKSLSARAKDNSGGIGSSGVSEGGGTGGLLNAEKKKKRPTFFGN